MGKNGKNGQSGQKVDKKRKSIPRKETRTVTQVRHALMQGRGNISTTSQLLGFNSRETVRQYIKRHPSLEKTLETAREFDIDVTESQLEKLCKAGNPAAIIFKLKCKGKQRGWVEQMNIEGNIGIKTISDVTREALEERRKQRKNGSNGHSQTDLNILTSL